MTAPSSPAKPLPLADDITAPYWAAARERRLSLQFCRGCECFVHLPAAFCPRCTSADLVWRDMSGRGTLYSYTVMHDAPAPGFAGSLPYLVGIAELVEQPGLLLTADLLGASPDDVAIGMPLEVIFEELAPDSIVPQWRPRSA
ncbi:OB-fold domain-containing protein [Nocardia sp. NPDC004568]|uniref:Zn-ribbon domain-containing OB-fold protein n=1 Tax=Nocardia sp. NPDC004568 TaxID=3154551 RepID=UPI0033B23ADF